jgi:hypothetical protein
MSTAAARECQWLWPDRPQVVTGPRRDGSTAARGGWSGPRWRSRCGMTR